MTVEPRYHIGICSCCHVRSDLEDDGICINCARADCRCRSRYKYSKLIVSQPGKPHTRLQRWLLGGYLHLLAARFVAWVEADE